MPDLQELILEIIEKEDAAAVTPGLVRMRIEQDYEYDHEKSEIFDFMHQLEDEGVLEYHLGEYNEFSIADQNR